jgi:hypothetical protein
MLYFNYLICKQFYNIYCRYVLYMSRTDDRGFHHNSTDCPKMAQSYVFVYRYSRYVIFQRTQYFEPGAIYRKHKAHSLTNKFRKSMFVLFLLNAYDQCHDVQNERMRVLILHFEVLCSVPQIICSMRSK